MVRSFAAARPARGPRPTRRPYVGPLAAIAAVLALAACGGDDSSGATSTAVAEVADDTAAGSTTPTEPASADDTAVAGGDSTMPAMQPVEYVFEGEMPPLDGSAVAWRWAPGRSPTTDEIAKLAAALGVSGDVTEQAPDTGGGWTVGSEGATRVTVGADAQASWSLIAEVAPVCVDDEARAGAASSGSTASDVAPGAATEPTAVVPPATAPCLPPVGIPSADEAQARAIELLQALGLDPQEYAVTADSQEWGAWADARLLVDGIAAPALTSFGFGPEAVLTYASGQLVAPQPAQQYARIGTAAALEQLEADQFRSYGPAADPAATDAAPLPDTAPVDPDAPVSSLDPITVVLTGVEPGWWMVWAADGSVWLLPGYDFVTDQGEHISTPAIAQADLPEAGIAEPAPGAGEAPAEPDLAPPLGD